MRTLSSVALITLVSTALFAQSSDVPLRNWTVPPYRASGITTMTDATPPRVFIGVQPCRLVDTRAGSGFPAGFGAPGLSPGVPRNFDLDNDFGPCLLPPSGIDAYSLNVTVVNAAGPGHLVIYPQGASQPPVSSINYVAGQTIANAVIVPAGIAGGVTVVAAVSGADLLIDVNGYFSDTFDDTDNSLELTHASNEPLATFTNISTTCAGACGILSQTVSGGALDGIAGGGSAATDYGVGGSVFSTGEGSSGVRGVASTNSGITYGVSGLSSSSVAGSAGVKGTDHTGDPFGATGLASSGVQGSSNGGVGVFGISASTGVRGALLSGAGAQLANGYLGYAAGSDPPGTPPWAVFASGDIGATGDKHFLEPHPTDPSKKISYIALEGPEAGTYFRGRGRFQNGLARIAVPEDFRMVTDPEGLTVQITPIGRMATVGVLRLTLDEIVVEASRSVEFSYLVQGVRASSKHKRPIVDGGFMPESPNQTIPAWFNERQKRMLIQNGTYNADGTVNMETARRLGWDRVWAERKRPVPATTPE